MNGKLAAGIYPEVGVSPELLNPFVHHLELETTYEKIKTAILTVLLLPVRVGVICAFLISGWILACIGLWGLTEEDLRTKPVTGWRRKLTTLLCFLGKSTFTAGGMHVVIKGKQATRKEAPILVIAPHSTFLDGGIVYVTGFPSIIVRRESGANPYIGSMFSDLVILNETVEIILEKLINFTQPIYVWRDDPDSRQNTIKEIISRATSDLDWPQILIFPEGTCTNRSCLITFKPGAFYPGVPIQPVCIRYPNKLDTVTWTWEGPSALKLLWLTLTQVSSSCEIEFLPVYTPSEEEKKDPKLFASNVRAVMAKALGVPVLDYTYNDCKLMTRAKEMNLPHANSLVEVQKLRRQLGLDQNNVEESLIANSQLMCQDCSRLTYMEFANYLKVNPGDVSAQLLFKIYDENTGTMDFRKYLLGVTALSNKKSTLEILGMACKIYDEGGSGKLSADTFSKVLFHTLAMQRDYALEIFHQVDSANLGYITFEKFKQFAEKKAEFAGLFSISKEEKFKPRNGNLCPAETGLKKFD